MGNLCKLVVRAAIFGAVVTLMPSCGGAPPSRTAAELAGEARSTPIVVERISEGGAIEPKVYRLVLDGLRERGYQVVPEVPEGPSVRTKLAISVVAEKPALRISIGGKQSTSYKVGARLILYDQAGHEAQSFSCDFSVANSDEVTADQVAEIVDAFDHAPLVAKLLAAARTSHLTEVASAEKQRKDQQEASAKAEADARSADDEAWSKAHSQQCMRDSKCTGVAAYLTSYPKGRYADEAQRMLSSARGHRRVVLEAEKQKLEAIVQAAANAQACRGRCASECGNSPSTDSCMSACLKLNSCGAAVDTKEAKARLETIDVLLRQVEQGLDPQDTTSEKPPVTDPGL